MFANYWNFPNQNVQIGMSRQLDSSTTTQVAWITVHGRSSCSSSTESVWSPSLGMSLCTSWKRIVLSRFGRTNIFPWSCMFGMHSKTVWNKWRYCWQLQNMHVWITNFRGEELNNFKFREISCFFVVLRQGRSYTEMCGAILWVGNKTTQQLYEVSTPWINDHHFKEEEIKSVGELWNSMFPNCSVCFWKSCIYSNQLWMCEKQTSVSHLSTESEISFFGWD